MGAINPIAYLCPDGVERLLRYTLGAQRRMTECFGMPNLLDVLNKYGDGAIPRMIYQCLYDEKGSAPAFSVEEFEESFPPEEAAGALAALMSAATQGKKEKKELEAAIRGAFESQIGSVFGPLEFNASDSQT